MKRDVFSFKLLSAMLVATLCFGLSSCSKDDGDEDAPEPFITVNGSDGAEHTFPGAFGNGKSGIDYKAVFKIKSNVQWSLSGKVDWLNVSPTSGNGEVELSVYPVGEYDSDSSREAVLILSDGDESVSIKIIQEGKFVDCYVIPANEVALYDRFCWEYSASSNVNEFQYVFLSEREYTRLTDRELRELVMDELENDPMKFDDDYISMIARDYNGYYIDDNSTYYFVSLATDKEGNYGALKKVKMKTPTYYDGDEDAYVSFDNIGYNSYMFQFDVKKEGYCNTYHMIYGVYYEYINPAVYAFEINYYLKNKKKHWLAKTDYYEWEIVTDYPNNHTFSYTNYLMSYYPICFGYGWGVFKNGNLSSDLIGFEFDSLSGEISQRKVCGNSEDKPENMLIKRSEVMSHAQQISNYN